MTNKNPLINAININKLNTAQPVTTARKVNVARTDNGAVSNRTTESAILDYFYHAPAMRGKDVTKLVNDALSWDVKDAIAVMFYIRDVRGGTGERQVFNQSIDILRSKRHDLFVKVVKLIPFYGYWKDIIRFVDEPAVVQIVADQLRADQVGVNPSLLAKWLPSENASSKQTRRLARRWCAALGMTLRTYRKTLAGLRVKLNVVERDMSAQRWNKIKYENVPSKANKRYRKAFEKHDYSRYNAFLNAVVNGDKKMNADTLYPYEILTPLFTGREEEKALEALWKSLPNYAGDKNVLVVCDVSGSMGSVGNRYSSQPQPIQIAISLTMYFAERNKGAFKDHFLTFSHTPELVQIKGNTLREKVNNICRAKWEMNTDIQKTFDLILTNAVKHKVPQDEMPASIVIISDMQFDACGKNTNLAKIKQKYIDAGYTLPQLVFWNVNSSARETPAKMDESGVVLVSGASHNVFKSLLNSIATNPYEFMMNLLHSDRYAPVYAAIA